MQNHYKSLIQGCDQKNYGRSPKNQTKDQQHGHAHREQGRTLQLPAFRFKQVKKADHNFSKAVHAANHLP